MRLKMGNHKVRLIILASLFMAAMFAMTVTGLPEFEEELPDEGANFGCRYCHESPSGGGPINQFGSDFRDGNFIYNVSLGIMDSDGDGFTNEEEFDSKPVSNPGDPESYPDPESTNNFILVFVISVIVTTVAGLILIWRK